MNRRDALQQLGALALLSSPIGLALGHSHGQAQGSFQVLKTKVPSDTPGKIQVLEFFHYGCSHCHDFEPLIAQWAERLPNDVVFMQVPVVWGKQLEGFARLYYTLQAMKRLDLHKSIFPAVQEQRMRLDSPAGALDWAKANKLNESSFRVAYDIGVNSQVRRAQQLTVSHGIESVPSMVVDGRFLTSASLAGNHEAALRVVDSLIERVRKGE
ncbi:MAG: thiol:disulfide interchange protein DsbA/DsbL [Betaproteobacteria bacterium]|nr:thiol:disulfide interchange protein DsbA/DsbL [Betaproteobacteria bacterium]